MSSSASSESAERAALPTSRLLAALERAMGDDADPAEAAEVARSVMNLAVERYARTCQDAEAGSPFTATPPAATDVVITVGAMLEAVDVEVFELAMWQSWGRS